ncbi:MAG: hypothetical protein IKT72_07000, partial [Clostridia bacterium]|nr:hypothetical protein [Clostridia bacterium]
DYPMHYVAQQYLPRDLADRVYYTFGDNRTESTAKAYYEKLREIAKQPLKGN